MGKDSILRLFIYCKIKACLTEMNNYSSVYEKDLHFIIVLNFI